MIGNQIGTTHMGHDCVLDEERDEWECRALALKARSLKALRTKIDKVDADRRRLGGGIPVLIFNSNRYHGSDITPGMATLLDKDGKGAFVTYTERSRRWQGEWENVETRRKYDVGVLLPRTDAVTEAVEALRTLTAERKALDGRIDAAIASVSALAFTAEALMAAGATKEADHEAA